MRPLPRRAAASASITVLLSLLATAPLTFADSASGLGIEITRPVQCVRKTREGDNLSVNYRGTLQSDGSQFDSSYGAGPGGHDRPFDFVLGNHQVIKGWDEGLLNMCIGEGRRLIIPPEMAYGNRPLPKIPPGSTLVFDTKLLGIAGVEAEPNPMASNTATSTPDPPTAGKTASSASTISSSAASATSTPVPTGSEKGPKDQNDGECRLLGPFALLVQAALGILALSSLVWKRYRERPRRPLKIWAFDASKQVVGSALLHLANLFMSMLSSGDLDVTAKAKAAAAATALQDGERQPNPCSFYLLNLAIDTTIGIPILVLLLRLLHAFFLHTPLANPRESIQSGNYGQPPRASWWAKQCLIYFLGLFGMKLCVFAIFQLLPWIAWVGDWALRWTEGNEALQITFVMLVFPLVMNALQYYIIDGFIKGKGDDGHGEHVAVPTEEEDEEEREAGDGEVGGGDGEEADARGMRKARVATREAPLKEANPTPVPLHAERREYDPEVDGASASSSSGSSTGVPEVKK